MPTPDLPVSAPSASVETERRAADVRAEAVAGLEQRWSSRAPKKYTGLGRAASTSVRRFVHSRVRRASGAEEQRLEMREARVVALDGHHRVPRLEPIALVQRVHLERGEVVAAQLEQRDRLVDAAEPPSCFAENCQVTLRRRGLRHGAQRERC